MSKLPKPKKTWINNIFYYWQEAITEFIGSFILVFAGCGAVMVDSISNGSLSHLGVSFVFGAVVAVVIYSTQHISEAHINPAVTLAFWTSGFFARQKVIPYVVAQCLGAITASGLLLLTLGKVANLGATLPLEDNWLQSLILETILTFILMFVILGSGLDRRAAGDFAGLAIGLTVGLEAAFMGPITGASMNPARSLGPAFVSGLWQHHWLYWVAPIMGAQLAVVVYGFISNGFHDIK